MLSTTTSTSQGRSVPFFFGLFVFLFFMSVSCLTCVYDPASSFQLPASGFRLPVLRGGHFAGRGFVREGDQAGFEARLVAIGRVQVAELVVRRDRAPAGADGDERAVVAHLPRRELLQVPHRLRAVLLL